MPKRISRYKFSFVVSCLMTLVPLSAQAESIENQISIPVERDSARVGQGRPAAPVATASHSVATNPVAQASNNDAGLWELFNQLEQLQEEVRQLRGQLEEQANQMEMMRRAQRERYLDLDRRLTDVSLKAPVVAPVPVPTSTVGAATSPIAAEPVVPGAPKVEEKALYKKAQGMLRKKQWNEAKDIFLSILQQYPNGFYQPYAHYWLGEVYLALPEADVQSAKTHFENVINQFSDHAKVPASLYKLAQIQDSLGNTAEAKKILQRVINNHGGSTSAKLAKNYLQQMQKR